MTDAGSVLADLPLASAAEAETLNLVKPASIEIWSVWSRKLWPHNTRGIAPARTCNTQLVLRFGNYCLVRPAGEDEWMMGLFDPSDSC